MNNLSTLEQFTLNINENQIWDTEAFTYIGNSLSVLKGLKKLVINVQPGNNMVLEGAQALSKGIKNMENLKNLHIYCERSFKGKGNSALFKGIGNLRNLEILHYKCEASPDQDCSWDWMDNLGKLRKFYM